MKRTLTAAAAACLMPATAHAQDLPTPQVSVGVTAATDYIFRGVSQTRNDPAIFGSARLTVGQLYAGAGIENVDFNTSITAEYDLSAGWKPTVAGFALDLGVIRYGYLDEPAHHIDTVDFKAVASHRIGPATIGAAVYYTPDYFGSHRDGVYYEANGAVPVWQKLSLSAALGRQTIGAGGDYTTWNAGADYALAKHLSVGVHYYDTDTHGAGKVYGSHVVGAISAAF